MAVVEHPLPAPPEKVFAVLTTPETYPLWLVGCQEIRAVDEGWPAVGSAFHHRVGLFGPLTVADNTKVLEIEAPRRLVLEVRARPLGRGRVIFALEPGRNGGTRLTLDEVPIGVLGVLRLLVAPLTTGRNAQSLQRLEDYLDADQRLHELLA